MPPKQKFNKEVVLETAFQLVREQGVENLNARSLAKMLHSSVQPVFSYYDNMTDLKTDLLAMVNEYHSRYFDKVIADENLFTNVGLAYISFAIEEPNLFKLLFMTNGFDGKHLSQFVSGNCNEHITSAIPDVLDRSISESNSIFTDMWLYAHGIASMIVTNQLSFERSEIESMLKNMFSLLTSKQTGENNEIV